MHHLDGDDLPIYSPTCAGCVHLRDLATRTCDAFPGGIPPVIWRGDNRHTEPYRGDGGVMFEALPFGPKPRG